MSCESARHIQVARRELLVEAPSFPTLVARGFARKQPREEPPNSLVEKCDSANYSRQDNLQQDRSGNWVNVRDYDLENHRFVT